MNKQSLIRLRRNRLKQKYQQEIRLKLAKELGLKNLLAAPRVLKVVINTGVKEMAKDKGQISKISEELMAISGQKPKVCRAKKSIAGFKLVKGDPIGLKVTLRRERMYNFLEKLFMAVLPRVRDFQGVSLGGFDGNGNYTLGVAEQIVFSEIDYGKIDKVRGLEVTIVTNAENDEKARKLLEEMGMPFEKQKIKNKK